jgi:hypothetical protein
MDDDDPKKEYYRKMYNRFCIYCKNVDEHTDHILTCQNNDDRKKIAVEVWNDIYEEIERKAKGNLNHERRIRALFPFILAPPQSAVEFWTQYANADPNVKKHETLKSIATFPVELQAMAYAPNRLREALRVLCVQTTETKALAEWIVIRLHLAVQEVLQARRRKINKDRHQRELYQHYVLGKPQEYVLELLQQQQQQQQQAPNGGMQPIDPLDVDEALVGDPEVDSGDEDEGFLSLDLESME